MKTQSRRDFFKLALSGLAGFIIASLHMKPKPSAHQQDVSLQEADFYKKHKLAG